MLRSWGVLTGIRRVGDHVPVEVGEPVVPSGRPPLAQGDLGPVDVRSRRAKGIRVVDGFGVLDCAPGRHEVANEFLPAPIR